VASLDLEIESRVERLQKITATIDSMRPAVERLTQVAENAELNVITMAHHAASLMLEIEDRSRDAESLLQRCEATSDKLDDRLERTTGRLHDLTDTGGRVCGRLESASAQARSAHEELAAQIESAQSASRELAIDVQTCEAMEALLEELRPWRSLVANAGVQGDGQQDCEFDLPEPAAQLVNELHARLDRDLNAFSSILAHVAEQFRMFAERNAKGQHGCETASDRVPDDCEQIHADDEARGRGGVVSMIRPESPLSFSSHAGRARAE